MENGAMSVVLHGQTAFFHILCGAEVRLQVL